MTLKTQAKVLRVLQEQRIEPVGGTTSITVDVRVIAATNKHLEDEIRKGTFREDLYFRLNVIPFEVPPLRERREDIPALARHFIAQFSEEYGKRPKELTAETLDSLTALPWPGNVRELRNIIERLVIMTPGERIEARHLPAPLLGTLAPASAGRPPSGDIRPRGLSVARRRTGGFREAVRLEEVPGVRREHEPDGGGAARWSARTCTGR